MTDWQYVAYILGSLAFLTGSLLGWLHYRSIL